ncbi:MAG TPA: thioredoxin [Candidatus Limnocylindrales bacterium]|nr:thioredoxin [Candidatus Limnocylindrales bacterium]
MTAPGHDSAAEAAGSGPVTILTCSSCGARNRIRPNPKGAPHCGTCGKALAWIVNADDATFDIETRAAPTVVVDLWAPWCGPCRFVGPILEQLAAEHAGRLKLVKVNVDDNQRLAIRFDAMSIPTIVVLRDGTVVDRIVGALPKPELAARLAPHLARR